MAADTRDIVLLEDGRFITLGRHSIPTEDELQRAGAQIEAAGLSAWYVVAETRNGKRVATCSEPRQIATGTDRGVTFEQA
jgi:hypothetical protein